jgi:hypothetical protein
VAANIEVLGGANQWSVRFIREAHDWEVDDFASFFCLLHSVTVRRGCEDELWWTPSKKCIFTVKIFFHTLVNTEGRGFPWKSVWRTKAPSRAAFFTLLAALGKILTMDNLKKRQAIVINRCCMCKSDGESVDHLLLHCDIA